MDEHTKHKGHGHGSVHKGHSHHNSEKSKESIKIKKSSMWQITSAILGLLLIVSIFTSGFGFRDGSGKITGMMTADAAADKAVNFIGSNLLAEGQTATLKSVEEDNQLYMVRLEIGGQEFKSYITKDGKLLFPSAIDLEEVESTPQQATPPPSGNVLKKEKTEVDLFVMSYCPYGMQAQKAMVPVMELLGDKADIKIRFVNYIMHGKEEIDENNVQYCIQKEQGNKMVSYLGCFLESQDSEACLVEAGVDKRKLDSCISEADKQFGIEADYADKGSWSNGRYPKYKVDDGLNNKYSVSGSPTLIINGQSYSGSRTPEGFKQAICAGFEEPPEECEVVLSGAAAAASGSCN